MANRSRARVVRTTAGPSQGDHVRERASSFRRKRNESPLVRRRTIVRRIDAIRVDFLLREYDVETRGRGRAK